jgi:hypothetical protein
MLKLLLIFVVFILGLYFNSRYTSKDIFEGFDVNKNSCPNILIQKGTELYLHNSKMAKIPGVNPVKFNNLEEYVEFLDWQRSKNIKCPVLFLQQAYDTQGKPVYKFRPSPLDVQGGLPPVLTYGTDSHAIPLSVQESVPEFRQEAPETKLLDAGRDDDPYNFNSYPAYDPINLHQGEFTPLDKMFKQQEGKGKLSTNAMDVNWGGKAFTDGAINAGYYKGEEVYLSPG